MPRPTKVTTQVNNWDAELAKFAEDAVKSEPALGSNYITTSGGALSYKGAAIRDNKIRVVVIDHAAVNLYYPGVWDPKAPTPPHCFAYGRDAKTLKPHEESHEPQGSATGTCVGCPQNEFGTARVGKGKACQNTRRLALIVEGDLNDVANAEVALLKVPTTSVAAWSGYVNQIANTLKRPPFGVITEITRVPDAVTQFRLEFRFVSVIEDGKILQALMERRPLVETELLHSYPPMPEVPAPAANPRGPRSRKY